MPPCKPSLFAHVVYRTRRHAEMLAWYEAVFGATIQQQDAALAFLTYDDEHHRFAFVDLDVVLPDAQADEERGLIGVDHVAYTLDSLDGLFENYSYLKERGITPYWCVHHGMTVSMYYADPDGNQTEFQVDAFPSKRECAEFLRSPLNAKNPVGVEYDPDEWLARLQGGASAQDLLIREHHEPVSPIRGYLAGR